MTDKLTREEQIRVHCIEQATIRTPFNFKTEEIIAVAAAYEEFIKNGVKKNG